MKTTSFETVAHPKFGDGRRRSQSRGRLTRRGRRAVRALQRVELGELLASDRAAPAAQVDDRHEEPAVRVGHRRLDAAEEARTHGHPARWKRADVVPVHPDDGGPAPLRVSRSQAITRPAFPAPKTTSTPSTSRESASPGSRSPERRAESPGRTRAATRARFEHEERVGVQHRARESAAVRPLRRTAPRAPGSSCPRRADPASRPRPGFQSPPPPASSGNLHGSLIVTNFQRTAPVAASSA